MAASPSPPAAPLLVEPPPNSALGSVLALINSTVGAGVLAFPFAFRQTGWAAGLACTFGIASIEAGTMYVLARFAEHTGCKTYSQLVRKMLCPAASLAMCLVMFLYPFGSCIAYLVIVGDSFQPLLLGAFGAAWWTSRAAVITGIGCTCILPLCIPTRLGALKLVSSTCMYGLMVVVVAIVFRSTQMVLSPDYFWAPVKAFNPSLNFLTALPLIVFAFHPPCSATPTSSLSGTSLTLAQHFSFLPRVVPLQACRRLLWRKSRMPSSRGGGRRTSDKLAGMIWVVAGGVGITSLFYSCVALAGYLAFPATARSNIILNFSQDDWLMKAARACIGLIQICAYPVNHHPARGAVRDFVLQTTGVSLRDHAFYVLEPLLFFGTTLGLALVCSDLGIILKLVGGTCGSMLIFFMPGALLVQYCLTKHSASQQNLQQPLLQPFLPAAADDATEAGIAGLDRQQHEQQAQRYSLWSSKLFWSGMVLLLISAFVTLLTIGMTLHPLPSS